MSVGTGRPPAGEDLTSVIAREYMLALQACDELEAETAARFQPWPGRKQKFEEDPGSVVDEIVALEWARSRKTFRASVTLCRAGFGEQAAMLNRSLFEGMAVAHWAHANEEEAAERFKAALRYDRHLTAALVERVGLWDEEIDEKALQRARISGKELDGMIASFGKFGERLWTGHRNLPKLVSAIEVQWADGGEELRSYHAIAHRDNNLLLHSTVAGLSRALARSRPEGGSLWVGPTNVHIDQALFGAHWCYLQTVTLTMDHFEFPDREGFRNAVRGHQFLLRSVDPDDFRGIGRNDTCPCGSEKKYKNCHEEQVEIRRVLRREREG